MEEIVFAASSQRGDRGDLEWLLHQRRWSWSDHDLKRLGRQRRDSKPRIIEVVAARVESNQLGAAQFKQVSTALARLKCRVASLWEAALLFPIDWDARDVFIAKVGQDASFVAWGHRTEDWLGLNPAIIWHNSGFGWQVTFQKFPPSCKNVWYVGYRKAKGPA